MEKERLNEITTLVERHWEKHPKGNHRDFYLDLIQNYGLTDDDWEEVIKEYNRRTDKIERRFWFKKNIIDPLLTILGYLLITYTSLFLTLSLTHLYTLPSQILFPEGTYIEREQLVNNLNLVLLGLGFLSIYILNGRKKNK